MSQGREQDKPKSSFNKPHHDRRWTAHTIHSISTILIETPVKKFERLISNNYYLHNTIYLRYLFFVIVILFGWLLFYLILHEKALPRDELFRIVLLIIVAHLAGWLFELCRLPALIAMLLTGIIMRSTGYVSIEHYKTAVSTSRDIAMSIILIKAGLLLDAEVLHQQKWTVLKLCTIPCLSEATAAMVISHFLMGLPWLWGLLLGFLLSSVSPAVVIPPLVKLKEQGYGEDKGMYTLIIASSSMDDISSITAFGIVLSVLFRMGSPWKELRHPVSVIIGIICGILWGLVCGAIPHKDDDSVAVKRTAMLALGGISAILGSIELHAHGAGPLACIVAAVAANTCWKLQGWKGLSPTPVERDYKFVWVVMQPILFGLIGAEVDIFALQFSEIGAASAVIIGSIAFRTVACGLSLIGAGLNFKEIVFVNIAWLPKATVQAVLSPAPLDILRRRNIPETDPFFEYAILILTTGVLSILITTPIGAILLKFAGPLLLNKLEGDTLPSV